MSSSAQDVSRDVDTYGKTIVLEGSNHESPKGYFNVISEKLFKGEPSSDVEKGQVHDTILPPPLYARQPLQPLVPGEISHNGLSFGLAPTVCDEPNDDISTESDRELEESHKKNSDDVTSNLTNVATSNDCNASSLGLKENMVDDCENLVQELSDNIGIGKSCTCSFCLKAAHMWMDLAFQDTRGRLTELRKSKKRAHDQIGKVTQDCSKIPKAAKMEFDLMQHWKMLFVQTQNSFARELAQTQSELEARSKMMDKCKRELESRSNNAL